MRGRAETVDFQGHVSEVLSSDFLSFRKLVGRCLPRLPFVPFPFQEHFSSSLRAVLELSAPFRHSQTTRHFPSSASEKATEIALV